MHLDSITLRWTAELEEPNGPDTRWFLQAVAQISYQLADGHRRLEWLRSAGLGGIDDGTTDDYKTELQYDEMSDLRLHLTHFGIRFSDQEWTRLTRDAVLKIG